MSLSLSVFVCLRVIAGHSSLLAVSLHGSSDVAGRQIMRRERQVCSFLLLQTLTRLLASSTFRRTAAAAAAALSCAFPCLFSVTDLILSLSRSLSPDPEPGSLSSSSLDCKLSASGDREEQHESAAVVSLTDFVAAAELLPDPRTQDEGDEGHVTTAAPSPPSELTACLSPFLLVVSLVDCKRSSRRE